MSYLCLHDNYGETFGLKNYDTRFLTERLIIYIKLMCQVTECVLWHNNNGWRGQNNNILFLELLKS